MHINFFFLAFLRYANLFNELLTLGHSALKLFLISLLWGMIGHPRVRSAALGSICKPMLLSTEFTSAVLISALVTVIS